MAAENFKNAGFSDQVKILIGPAVETLRDLSPDPPFDFIFIDADKHNYPAYFKEAKRLVKTGGVIVSSVPIFTGSPSLRALLRTVPDRSWITLFEAGESAIQNSQTKTSRVFARC